MIRRIGRSYKCECGDCEARRPRSAPWPFSATPAAALVSKAARRLPSEGQQEGAMGGTRIGVVGCGGRMGRMLLAEIAATEGCSVAGGAEAPGSKAIGRDLGELAGIGPLGLAAGSDRATLFAASDVVIDFTIPAATVAHAALAAEQRRALVIGTTGLDTAQSAAVAQAARQTPIV